jgi:hypothetical protein
MLLDNLADGHRSSRAIVRWVARTSAVAGRRKQADLPDHVARPELRDLQLLAVLSRPMTALPLASEIAWGSCPIFTSIHRPNARVEPAIRPRPEVDRAQDRAAAEVRIIRARRSR